MLYPAKPNVLHPARDTTDTHIEQPDQTIFGWARREVREFGYFWFPFLAWVIGTAVFAQLSGEDLLPSIANYGVRVTLLLKPVLYVLPLVAVYLAFKHYDGDLAKLRDKAFRLLAANSMVFRLCVAAITFPLFMGCFLFWKIKIPLVIPYSWDRTFADWDQLLFGGYNAYEWLLPAFSNEAAIRFIDGAYTIWGAVAVMFWVFVITSKSVSRELRNSYWFATFASWILVGLIAATVFSSAGPVYYHIFNEADFDRFHPLMRYLGSFDENLILADSLERGLIATKFHSVLWGVQSGWLTGPGGISAMPSMHNAQALLFVLLGFQVSRILGGAMLVFLAVTFLGSILLAWHYAVDAFVAYAMVAVIWHLSQKLVQTKTMQASD